MTKILNNRLVQFLVLLLCLICWTLPLAAAEQAEVDSWQFTGELFGFLADVDGTASTGEDIGVSLSDVLKNLDFAAMGSLAASKNRWTIAASFIYANIGDRAEVPVDLPPVLPAKLNLDLRQFITTVVAGYRIFENQSSEFNLLAGGRYNSIDIELDYDIGSVITGKEKDNGNVLDFIVGAQGKTDLSDKWYLHYYADIGTGDSDRTWQALAGLNYRFKKVDLTLGYAYIDWKFKRDAAIEDMTLSGPYVGIKFGF